MEVNKYIQSLDDPVPKFALVGMQGENIIPNKKKRIHILFKCTWSIPPNCSCIDKEISTSVYTTQAAFTDHNAIQLEIKNKNLFRNSTSVNFKNKNKTSKYQLKKEIKMKNSNDSEQNKTKHSK